MELNRLEQNDNGDINLSPDNCDDAKERLWKDIAGSTFSIIGWRKGFKVPMDAAIVVPLPLPILPASHCVLFSMKFEKSFTQKQVNII